MVTEIRSETDRIFCHSTDINFCHSGSCFALFTPLKTYKIRTLKTWKNTWRYYWFTQVYRKWQSYHVWFQRYGTWRSFCHFGFFPFTSLTTQKIKIFQKWKKRVKILSFYTINDNHIMYCSWDIECNRQILLSFWTAFCPFSPLTTQKM